MKNKELLEKYLRYDISWGCDIKDKKLLDTVMERVMETIEAVEKMPIKTQ